MRILNLEPEGYSAKARAILETLGEITDGPLTREQLLEQIGTVDVLIVRLAHQIDPAVIEAGRKLDVVVSATTGLDHIDRACCKDQKVTVLSLQTETDFLRTIPATAEHTWGLILSVMRHIPQASRAVLRGEWDRDALRGHDLAGKHLGILGLGRLGTMVARFGLAFGMKVEAYDPNPQAKMMDVERADSLAQLLPRCDLLTIHVPLNPDTWGLISEAEIVKLPKGAVLINTSRAEIVDEAALLSALSRGHLSGAAVDVVSGERDPGKIASHPMVTYAQTHDNLIITPHLGGATFESMASTEVYMAQKLAEFLGKPVPKELL